MLGARATLCLLLGIAAVIGGGGVMLSRREEQVRHERDREPLMRCASVFQEELDRLGVLYESHLRVVALNASTEVFVIRSEAQRVAGIVQVSVLDPTSGDAARSRGGGTGTERGAEGLHVTVGANPGVRIPMPVFSPLRAGSVRTPLLLDAAELLGSGARSGWRTEPAWPLVYWQAVSPRELVVMLLDRAVLETVVAGHFRGMPEAFHVLHWENGAERLRSRSGAEVFSNGAVPGFAPDLVLPLRSRFGDWDLLAWDPRTTRVVYRTGVLVGAGVAAVLVAGLGLILYVQGRRARVLASQRVSFVNRVSHELRTPLTNILLNLDLAADAQEVEEEARPLALVREEVRRLARLIENVLTFSERERRGLRARPGACCPASVVAAVVEQFAAGFERRGMRVETEGLVMDSLLIDGDALAQILANLLSNAEKYAPGGPVQIAMRWDGARLWVRVRDHGPGIPRAAWERVFEPFERLSDHVRDGVTGTGLGLCIARDIARAMGGALRVVSSEGGAVFELEFPACAVPGMIAVA